MNRFILCSCLMFVLYGCALQRRFLTQSYNLEERQRLKRVALILDDRQNIAKLDELFLRMAREYVSHKKEYIIYTLEHEVVDVQRTSLIKLCEDNKNLDGLMIHHWEKFSPRAQQIRLQMTSELIDCKNLKLVWKSVYGNNYKLNDPTVAAVVRSWEGKVGTQVSEYVGPLYHFLDDLYFTLPDPVLSETDIDEKVEKDSEL